MPFFSAFVGALVCARLRVLNACDSMTARPAASGRAQNANRKSQKTGPTHSDGRHIAHLPTAPSSARATSPRST